MRAALVTMMILAAGCGTAGAEDQRGPVEPVSGSRLVVQAWEGADGSRLPVGLFDRELGVRCEPRLAADGVTRCLPVGARSLSEVRSDHDLWVDEARTIPAWSADPELGYSATWPMEGDTLHPRYCDLPRAPRIILGPSDVWCGPTAYEVVEISEGFDRWGPVEGDWLRTTGAEIPPDAFVEMTLSR